MEDQGTAQITAFGERFKAFFDVDPEPIIASVEVQTPKINAASGSSLPIQLVPVHTFIVQGHTKDVNLTRGILVPSFASHWGVVVGEQGAYELYHLVFQAGQQTNGGVGDSIRGPYREVEFNHTKWQPKENARGFTTITKVGETRYSHWDLIKIVGAPLATTLKAQEEEKAHELLKAFRTDPTQSTQEMELYSDQAIAFVLHQASIEPENQRILCGPVPARHNKGTAHMLVGLVTMLKYL